MDAEKRQRPGGFSVQLTFPDVSQLEKNVMHIHQWFYFLLEPLVVCRFGPSNGVQTRSGNWGQRNRPAFKLYHNDIIRTGEGMELL